MLEALCGFFHSETVRNVLISLVTSAIVGFFTFAFGMKSGKNQADRAKVQEIYTEVLNEFEAIYDNLNSQPREWDDYPQKRDRLASTPVTPLREIISRGDYVFIGEEQTQELKELENDALSYGWQVLMLAKKIPRILYNNPELFNEPGSLLDTGHVGKPAIYNKPKGSNDCGRRVFRFASIYDFFDEQKLVRQLNEGIEVVFNDGRTPEHVVVTIVPELLSVTPAEFADAVTGYLMAEEGAERLFEEKSGLSERLKAQVELLRRQARDPFPFWKTLGSAIGDFFRVK